MTAASLLAALVAIGVVRVVRSPIAGGNQGASTARRAPAMATGGIAVLAGLLLAVAFLPAPAAHPARYGLIALAAGLLAALADRGSGMRYAPVVVSLVAASAVVVAGVRLSTTATVVSDVVVSVLWIVVVIEAVSILDEARGQAATLLAPAAAAMAAMAVHAGQRGPAIVLVAVAASLVGLLIAAPNAPRVRIGRPGATAVGTVLAGGVAVIEPVADPLAGLALTFSVLALPLVLAAVVVVGRLRRGDPVSERGRDGVLERLRIRGVRSTAALLVLGAVQLAVAASVVAADQGLVHPAVVVVGVFLAVALLAVAIGASRVRPPGDAEPGRGRLAVVTVGALVLVFVAPPVTALALSAMPARAGAAAAERAVEAARRADTGAARVAFAEAGRHFGRARSNLDLPLADLGLVVPVLGPNLAGARVLADLGQTVSETGSDVVEATGDLRVTAGAVPIDAIRRVAPELRRTTEVLSRGEERLDGTDRTYLVGPVRDGFEELDRRFAGNVDEAAQAARAAEAAPAILGADEPRRYFLAMQNNAELRATGGFIGNFGELVVDDGEIELEDVARINELNVRGEPARPIDAPDDYLDRYERFDVASTWQSLNMSPDFPTVGRVIAGAYPASGGEPVDGVIAIDPVGLSALLQLTGPVQVPAWPEPITSANVVDVTLNEAYERFELEDRTDFLADVAAEAMKAATSRPLGPPATLGRVLGDAAEGGHLMVYLTRPEEQEVVEDLGIAGAVEPPRSDALLLVNQNAGANKVDYYLRRALRYEATLTPGAGRASVRGSLSVRLDNTAPEEGLDPYIAGTLEGLVPGTNRSYVSLYTPLGLRSATLDGDPVPMESETELGRSVYSRYVDIPAGGSSTMVLDLAGEVDLLPGGWYELRLDRQPLLAPDEVTVELAIAEGWRVVEVAGGAVREGDGRVVAELSLDAPTTLRIRIERPAD